MMRVSFIGMLFPLLFIIGIVFTVMLFHKKRNRHGRHTAAKPLMTIGVAIVMGIFFMRFFLVATHTRNHFPATIESYPHTNTVIDPIQPAVPNITPVLNDSELIQVDPIQPNMNNAIVWHEGLEDEFGADVYPSVKQAAKALGRELADTLPALLVQPQKSAASEELDQVLEEYIVDVSQEFGVELKEAIDDVKKEMNEQSVKQVVDAFGKLMKVQVLAMKKAGNQFMQVNKPLIQLTPSPDNHNGLITADVLNYATQGLKSKNPDLNISVETIAPDKPANVINPQSLSIQFGSDILVKSSIDIVSTGKTETLIQRSGILIATVSGPNGTIVRTVEFNEKPWVSNWSDFRNHYPNAQLQVVYSQESCTTPSQAADQAKQQAYNYLAQIVNANHQQGLIYTPPVVVDAAESYIKDRFCQKLQGRYGPIYREALLLDTSSQVINPMINATHTAVTTYHRSFLGKIAAGIALLALITVVYFYLNFATRGYYTWALRIGIVIGILIIVFFFMMNKNVFNPLF